MAVLPLMLAACGTPEPPALVLDGPEHVRVERLGPVAGPAIRLEDGTEPDGVAFSLSREGVARLDHGRLLAEGPGEVTVRAEWEDQRVEWTLHVELETAVSFVRPPERLTTGEHARLAVEVRAGDAAVEAPIVEWGSSDPAVLRVDPIGEVAGLRPGVAFVTARSGGGQAMAEIQVVAP